MIRGNAKPQALITGSRHEPDRSASTTPDTASVDLPMQTRMDVRLMPETVQDNARTIELVWSTGRVRPTARFLDR